ncbi:hypothetical protein GGF32_003534 [Allomyces javanicus]|nr:hypothetical protein GGF32_003534 [Allomyces javanicus]
MAAKELAQAALQAATDRAIHFLEHDLDLSSPADMDLALHEYRRFLILKVVHRDDRSYKAMKDALPFFIHHDPRGAYDEDAANRTRRLENTRACYRARQQHPTPRGC